MLWLPGLLDGLEGWTWTWRARAFAHPGKATGDIAVILLDQESLDWGESEMGLPWPWPREIIGLVADFCHAAGARSLSYDVLYTEQSGYGVEDEARFVKSVQDNGSVVAAMQLWKDQGAVRSWPTGIPKSGIAIDGLDQYLASHRLHGLFFPQATFPIPELGSAVHLLGNTNLLSDDDGVYRRASLFGVFDGVTVPSMGFAAFLAGAVDKPAVSMADGKLMIGDRVVPIDRNGSAIIRFRGPTKTHRAWRAAAIIRSAIQLSNHEQPEVDPSELRGKYVFFGYSAAGLFDLRPTPMAKAYPGVEVHATMLDNLLSSDFLRDMPLAPAIALLALLCISAGIWVSSASTAGRSVISYVVLLPLAPALAAGAYVLGWWLHLVSLELGVVLSLVGASLVSYGTEGKQRRFIKGAFSQYLSPTVIEQIIAHPERLKLGGELRELSIFFSDLQGFTTISEKLTPENLTALLNEYLSAMTDIIQEEGGTIDKFEGDAIIAFWNAPLAVDDHAVRAVRAALRCQEKLAEMRPSLKERYGELLMRIGMNSGNAVVGNMGSRTRFDYTMLGDAVNLAARLEGTNKQFRTYTMISATTRELMGDAFPVRELSRIAVVGRKQPVTVYEPMTAAQYEARLSVLETFDRGLRLYYEGRFTEAIPVFESIAADDPAAAAYVEQCRRVEKEHAGPWTGVWKMTEK